MLDFVWPLTLLLLPLPWLLRALQRKSAHPMLGGQALLVAHPGSWLPLLKTPQRRRQRWLVSFAWALLLLASARPEWLGDIVAVPRTGRDLMLAVDLSRSMGSMDFELGDRFVTRLQASQKIAGDFIERRIGDRIGLILFGSQAYVQAPLTFDRTTVRFLLDEAELGLAGKSTAIGDAIGIAVKRLRDVSTPSSKVLVLLTDGENTAGEIDPVKASELAKQYGIRIHTIGMSSRETQTGWRSEVDEQTLTSVATTTGGRYFRAHNSRELQGIYGEIDQLEPVVADQQSLRQREPLFMFPLAVALTCGLFAYWRVLGS